MVALVLLPFRKIAVFVFSVAFASLFCKIRFERAFFGFLELEKEFYVFLSILDTLPLTNFYQSFISRNRSLASREIAIKGSISLIPLNLIKDNPQIAMYECRTSG